MYAVECARLFILDQIHWLNNFISPSSSILALASFGYHGYESGVV